MAYFKQTLETMRGLASASATTPQATGASGANLANPQFIKWLMKTIADQLQYETTDSIMIARRTAQLNARYAKRTA